MPSESRPPRILFHNKVYLQDLVQSKPYKEECPTIISLPYGTKIYKHQEKIENFTIELTNFKQFAKEPYFIIKKQLEETTNTQEAESRNLFHFPKKKKLPLKIKLGKTQNNSTT